MTYLQFYVRITSEKLFEFVSLTMQKVKVLVAQLCPILCDPMDCSPPGSSVHGILQARTLEWVAIFFSRESSQARDRTRVSLISGRFFTVWATRKPCWHALKYLLIHVFVLNKTMLYSWFILALMEFYLKHWLISMTNFSSCLILVKIIPHRFLVDFCLLNKILCIR